MNSTLRPLRHHSDGACASGPCVPSFLSCPLLVILALLVMVRPSLALSPTLLRQFRSNEPARGDEFGWSVAVDGPLGIVGAPSRDGTAASSGSAFLFDVMTGQQLFELLPEDGAEGDLFGAAVSIQGNYAVVGAMLEGDAAGAAYVFDVATGNQLYKLLPNDRAVGVEFGVSVDIDDGIIIVGAHKDNTGSAYLFDAASGQQLRKIVSNDAAPDDLFGVAVALDEGTALVGARYDDDLGIASGSAYLFDAATGAQLHKLNAHDGVRGDRYGMHLDIGGNRAVIGARYDDDFLKSSGSAYIYDVTTGEQLHKLVPQDTTNNDQFGSAISVDGDKVLIGALDDDHNGVYAGSAYLFDVNTGEELFKFNAPDATPYDRMGISASMDDGVAVIGASMLDFVGSSGLPSGKVYVYQIPEPAGGLVLLAAFGLIAQWSRHR